MDDNKFLAIVALISLFFFGASLFFYAKKTGKIPQMPSLKEFKDKIQIPFLNESEKDDQSSSLKVPKKKKKNSKKTNKKDQSKKEEKEEGEELIPSLLIYVVSVAVALLAVVIYLFIISSKKTFSSEEVEKFLQYNECDNEMIVTEKEYKIYQRVSEKFLCNLDSVFLIRLLFPGLRFYYSTIIYVLFLVIINPLIFTFIKNKNKGFWKCFSRFHFSSLLRSIFWLLFLLISTCFLYHRIFPDLFAKIFTKTTFWKHPKLREVKFIKKIDYFYEDPTKAEGGFGRGDVYTIHGIKMPIKVISPCH